MIEFIFFFRKKDVIVIEEEEESKPLIAKLHEITKSSQDLAYNSEYASPPKEQGNQGLEGATRTSSALVNKDVSTVNNSKQRTSLSRQFAGTKRNASGSVVYMETQKDTDKDLSAVPKNYVEQCRSSNDQKVVSPAEKSSEVISSESSPNKLGVVSESHAKRRSDHASFRSQVMSPVGNQKSRERDVNKVNNLKVVDSELESRSRSHDNAEKYNATEEKIVDEEKLVWNASSASFPNENMDDAKDAENEAGMDDDVVSERFVLSRFQFFVMTIFFR